jgi:hypothetical protein
MAVSYFYGNTLVSSQEVAEKNVTGAFSKFNKSILKGEDPLPIFRGGIVKLKEINDNTDIKIPDRTPIGIGKPLSIEILCVYTGDAPNKLFGGKKDLLVVSGVRATNTHDESPRAINQLVKKVEDYKYIQPSAFVQGSPIIYYTSAVDVSTILCSLEMVADTFSESTFDSLSNLFGKAASIPIFFTSSLYLLAGSSIIKMASELGKSLFESKAFMKNSIPFYFDSPDMPLANARAAIVYNDKDEKEFKNYRPGLVKTGEEHRKALVHSITKEEYRGRAPYILLSIDGRDRDQELREFSPKIATASILEKFYGNDIETKSTGIIEDAMMLYNDLIYHNKATKLQDDMKNLNANSNEYKKAKELLDAYKKNIQSEQFKIFK